MASLGLVLKYHLNTHLNTTAHTQSLSQGDSRQTAVRRKRERRKKEVFFMMACRSFLSQPGEEEPQSLPNVC